LINLGNGLIETLKNKKFINPYIGAIKEFKGVVLSKEEFKKLKIKLPIVLDIGCGNGEYLAYQAKNNKNKFFIGFELQYKEVYRAAKKIKDSNLDNCIVLREDAKLIPEMLKKNSVSYVNILFPDPWPKQRQKKHRLIKKTYLEKFIPIMKKNSFIKIKTDDDDYFLQIFNSFNFFTETKIISLLEFSRDLQISKYLSKDDYKTPFQRIFIRQKKLINYVLYQIL
jgi:tRNA (guanine-N7-)-methyltransferase